MVQQGQRWKVLVVGGTDDERAAARTALERGGLEVGVRPDAIGTCAYILREHPDVVLLDPAASVLAPREVVGLIRDDPTSAGVVVLLWSDDSSLDLSALSRAVGADGWVRRGGDAIVFAADVRQWADRSATIRPARRREGSGVRRAREVAFVHGEESAWRTFAEQMGSVFSCRWAQCGRDAFRLLSSSEPPAAVVTEISLPDLGGDVLYRTAIRRDETWSARFVFATALPPAHVLVHGLRAWPAPVLFEPWGVVPMRRSIEAAIRAARSGAGGEAGGMEQ